MLYLTVTRDTTRMRHPFALKNVAQKILLATLFVLVAQVAYSQQTVFVTNTGAKYHRDGCQYLRHSKIAIHIDSASGSGYSPCSVCKPVSSGTIQRSVSDRSPSGSVQCSAKTKSGTRCSRQTKEPNGRCWQHQ